MKKFFASPSIPGFIYGFAIAEVFKKGMVVVGVAIVISTALIVVSSILISRDGK